MKWKLISFAEIETPMAPYVSLRVVGIVESEGGDRVTARVRSGGKLDIGMVGELMRGGRQRSDVFLPAYKTNDISRPFL